MAHHWAGESSAVVLHIDARATHLLSSEALAVLMAAPLGSNGATLREIGHKNGTHEAVDDEPDPELQGIIDALITAGLMLECSDARAAERPSPG